MSVYFTSTSAASWTMTNVQCTGGRVPGIPAEAWSLPHSGRIEARAWGMQQSIAVHSSSISVLLLPHSEKGSFRDACCTWRPSGVNCLLNNVTTPLSWVCHLLTEDRLPLGLCYRETCDYAVSQSCTTSSIRWMAFGDIVWTPVEVSITLFPTLAFLIFSIIFFQSGRTASVWRHHGVRVPLRSY